MMKNTKLFFILCLIISICIICVAFKLNPKTLYNSHLSYNRNTRNEYMLQKLFSSRQRDFSSGTAISDRKDAKPYGRASEGYKSRESFGGRGGSGGRSFGGRGGGRGGGSGGRNRRPESDYLLELRFSKTLKIDPELKTSIDDMNFSPKTSAALKEKGFTVMTPVQSQSYDFVKSGDDVVARSRTGTGKTMAFGLPLIEKIAENNKVFTRGSLPLVIVLEPTRELAIQVAQELSSIGAVHGIKVAAVYGGVAMFSQEKALQNGLHILVATPGRALDHISRGTLDLSGVEHVVLDEGDTMLEMGFQNDVESIIANVKTPGKEARESASKSLKRYDDDEDEWSSPLFDDSDDDDDDDVRDALLKVSKKPIARDVQMLLFSATMPGWICKLTTKHMNDPIFLDAVQEGETRLASTIKHFAIKLPSGERIQTLSSSIEDLILTKGAGGQTIVFTNTKDEADNIVAADCFGQLRAQVLHGDISQHGRQVTIKQFKEGNIDVLVATDVAARGLDIAGVDLVLHTGAPNDCDTYVHRSGRTGRAGRNGTSVMLYSYSDEERKLVSFERTLNFNFKRISAPSADEIARASAWYAAKKLEKVNSAAVNYFLPHAKKMINMLLTNNEILELPQLDDANDIDTISDETSNHEDLDNSAVEKLLARCLAAISNKNTIQTRSMLTGEIGKMTLHVNAVFKNGTSPSTVRDWQRVFSGIVRKSLLLEDVKTGRVAMGRLPKTRQFCGLFDVDTESGQTILDKIAEDESAIPNGIEISRCEKLVEIVEDNSGRGRDGGRDGGREWSRGGGGSRDSDRRFSRDGDRRSGGRDSGSSPYYRR